MKKIAILLATYNSSKYLRSQIDSLFNQSNQEWMLFVRDDCSNDNTTAIIKEYQKLYPGRIVILDNHNASKKAYLNFVELLKNVESDYYMFCDHDDVWLPNKIQISLDRMLEIEKQNPDRPVIVHTDMKVVDQDLNVICNSFWKYSRLLPDRNRFAEMVLCNSANGCAMMFNHMAKMVALPNIKFAIMHDVLLNQSVSANNGIIAPIKIPMVLYRQHTNNVVGAHKRDFRFYMHKLSDIPLLIKDNIDCYKRANRIKHIPLALFIFTKVKIYYLKMRINNE